MKYEIDIFILIVIFFLSLKITYFFLLTPIERAVFLLLILMESTSVTNEYFIVELHDLPSVPCNVPEKANIMYPTVT